jgi:hypothetical protein
MPTVKILPTDPETQGEFVVIDAADFNPDVHQLHPDDADFVPPGPLDHLTRGQLLEEIQREFTAHLADLTDDQLREGLLQARHARERKVHEAAERAEAEEREKYELAKEGPQPEPAPEPPAEAEPQPELALEPEVQPEPEPAAEEAADEAKPAKSRKAKDPDAPEPQPEPEAGAQEQGAGEPEPEA